MIGLPFVYTLAGLTFLAFAVLSLHDASNPKRWGNGAFWGLLALSMLAGDRLGDFGNPPRNADSARVSFPISFPK